MSGALAAVLVAVLRMHAPAPGPGDAPATTPDADAVRDPFAPIVRVDAPRSEGDTPRARHVPTHAPLRNPFEAGAAATTRAAISGDLKDPFARPAGARAPMAPHRDLRDPFEPRPGGATPGGCTTTGGVPLQRPKSLQSPPRCAPSDAPLLDPFRTA